MQVKLLAITPNGEELVASAYGICTSKTVPLENITKWMNMGHLSPLEHISATFLIEGISRACLAQLTRHRLCSFSVESQRYNSVEDNEVIIPQSVRDSDIDPSVIEQFIRVCKVFYKGLESCDIPKEDRRFFLPMGVSTKLIMTANAREWLHIFQERCNLRAQWEIRQLCENIRDILADEWSHIVKIGDEHDIT